MGVFLTNIILAAFFGYMYVEKAAKMTFLQKTRTYNIDEIDPWCQFHKLYVRIFHMNVISAAFFSYMYVEKAAKTTFLQKMQAYNIDEIHP